ARMIMTGEEFLGKEPFREVLVHATVMTEDGKRMSKSLGTGVDPLELIRLYGADATRFGLTSLVSESQDIRFKMQWKSGGKAGTGPGDELARAEQIEQMRNFCTKLWNISRFALMNLGENPPPLRPLEELVWGEFSHGHWPDEDRHTAPRPGTPRHAPNTRLELADRWILSRFAAASAAVNDALDRYALGEASWALYHFIWDELADWYLELIKPRLRSEDAAVSGTAKDVLLHVLEATLRLAHPFLPFITEEIWQSLPGTEGALILQSYPGAHEDLRADEAEERMSATIEVVRAIRNLKSELGAPNQAVDVHLSEDGRLERPYVEQSARARIVEARPEGPAATAIAAGVEISLAVAGLVDVQAETARLRKEIDAAEKELKGVEGKLSNEQFVSRAPAEVVEKQRRIREELQDRVGKLKERLRLFGG
ncbi:MAG TPA: class I tRNA ligase family protein, partial [Armatimonadota bacterium]|nr:class I tRNA ligase family protein [Armatimonadota bacterium]